MSALLFTDPHFHAFPAFARLDPVTGLTSRVKEGLDTLQWLGNLARDRNVESIVCLGDVFHVPGFLDPIVACHVMTAFQNWADEGFFLFTLGGNHDAAGNHHSSIGILPGTRVFLESRTVSIPSLGPVFMMPWRKNLNPAAEFEDDAKIAMGHFIAHDVEVSTGHRVHGVEGVTSEFLAKFNDVILGDAHKYQTVGNTTYLGSCLKNSFNDDGEAAYAFIASQGPNGRLNLEPVRNPYSPWFLRLSTRVRPIKDLMDWIEEVVLQADPNGAAVYLDLQASKKDAAKVTKRFAKTTLQMRIRPLLEEADEDGGEPEVRIQTTEATPAGIVRKYVAAKAEDSPADAADLVAKGEEYVG